MNNKLKPNNLLCNRFVKLIEENHKEITEHFMNDLLSNSETNGYNHIDKYLIYEASDSLYRDLSQWITKDYPKEKIAKHYLKLGMDRFEMGIPFPEVQKAMVLQKRHLWLFVMDKLYDDMTVYMEAVDLNNRVALYFDRATFFMLQGFDYMLQKNKMSFGNYSIASSS